LIRLPENINSWFRFAVGVVLFALAYAVADRFQLTHAVLYRAAVNDFGSALSNFFWLSVQAMALFAAIILLRGRLLALVFVLMTISIGFNLVYGQILNDIIDAGKLGWLISEARQAGNAAGEFTGQVGFALFQTVIAAILLLVARRLVRTSIQVPQTRRWAIAGLAAAVVPSLIAAPLSLFPAAAERNLYDELAKIAMAKPPPPRGAVTLEPQSAAAPRHIVWLVDESIAYRPFAEFIAPQVKQFDPVSFGAAASLANCSGSSNFALRAGLDVRNINGQTDLRTTPSIWGFAKVAGYKTYLLEGQASGAPQNLLFEPELKLIDQTETFSDGIDTDKAIARWLNKQLKSGGRSFTYSVLRGVHFQYPDHYPPGAIPANSPKTAHYEAALKHSKTGFFDVLLNGVDRQNVAIVYTSDHGQNFAPDAIPHCSREEVADEFSVPLMAFLPGRLADQAQAGNSAHSSASQVFPSTLIWMGYDEEAVIARYDNPLGQGTARSVTFGRKIIPTVAGEAIELRTWNGFPGTKP